MKNNKIKALLDDKNIFIYGLTGSGKDSLLRLIKLNGYEYVYTRLADTLKHVITEARLESFNELEVSKRGDENIRKMHNNIDETLRQFYIHPNPNNPENIGYNRAKMIMERKAFEFTNPPLNCSEYQNMMFKNPILISDVREENIIPMLLDAGWIGIFIDNIFRHKEYSNPEQKTEFNIFDESPKSKQYLEDLIVKHPNQMYFITDKNETMFSDFINDNIDDDSIQFKQFLIDYIEVDNGMIDIRDYIINFVFYEVLKSLELENLNNK